MTIVATQNAIVEGTEASSFYSEPAVVRVSWIKDFQEPVPNILNACTILSENLSRIKRESVNKDAFSVIGTIGAKFLKSVQNDSLMHRPDFFDHVDAGGNKFPSVVGKKDLILGLKMGEKLSTLLPMYTFLYTRVFTAYCNNPFDKKANETFIDHFNSKSLS